MSRGAEPDFAAMNQVIEDRRKIQRRLRSSGRSDRQIREALCTLLQTLVYLRSSMRKMRESGVEPRAVQVHPSQKWAGNVIAERLGLPLELVDSLNKDTAYLVGGDREE